MKNLIKSKLIPDWRDWWKWWSTYAAAALTVWNMMPFVLQEALPPAVHLLISLVLFGSFVLARVIDQPKLKETSNG